MKFTYALVPLWERPAAAPPDWMKKLLTDAFLLTGLRVRRDVAARIFRGVRAMHESDTYLAILDEGQEKYAKKAVLLVTGYPESLLGSMLTAASVYDHYLNKETQHGRTRTEALPQRH